ncbi:MAG: energy-coupling factor transporter ATP-binding protein EcfA2 [Psychroserpens sp.]|jgi:energy-coupling factor transporter ATP-binding protein EcfA2
MDKSYSLKLPQSDGSYQEIETNQSLIFIGANGSGKTRLGTWVEMESPQKNKVHRISAQKSLAMPDTTTPTSLDKAEKDLLYGYADAPEENKWAHKQGHKWQSKPAISLLNDYQKLMVYLFSDHTEEGAKYLAASKLTDEKVTPPTTKLDLVKQLWEKILPHRELVVGGLRIQTRVKNSIEKVYSSSEMSDGERVVFYLVGQCLAAQTDGIIVIDEPEIHLHKSIQAPLWREIEKLRPDCLFVYMTHDVDFAVSLHESKKIWLKSYDGQKWEWEPVEEIDGLPETLLVEVLGSRKPIVFVEGENGSYDTSLYRAVLPNHLVIPSGSCTQVIQAVKALRTSNQLHHLSVHGIIDRDRRVESELQSLEQSGIFSLEVAEVENLFCVPEVLSIISAQLERDPIEDFNKISGMIFSKMQSEIETQISLRAAAEIKYKLNLFDEKAKGLQGLTVALSTLISNIDTNNLYEESKSVFETVVENNDYLGLLKVYNRKSIPSQISKHLGLSGGGLAELVVRLACGSKTEEITLALKPYFGNFQNNMA